jgi:hypothetical protein
MKLQIEGQTLRFRIDEAELARLLAGDSVNANTFLTNGGTFGQTIALADITEPLLSFEAEVWKLVLPQAEVAAYSERLPCREGLAFALPGEDADKTLRIAFEVDVRDSVRQRIGIRRKL